MSSLIHEGPLEAHEHQLEAHEERVTQVAKNTEAPGMVNNVEDSQNVEAW